MDIVRFSIRKPVSVAVGVILIVMFGLIGVGAVPIQLTPNVDRPEIEVRTNWPGRSPEEIVDEIVKEQEERLKNVDNLKRMKSTSREGFASIALEFYIGTNIDRALQDVSDKLRQVPEYPDDVDEPTVTAKDGASENAIAWIILDLSHDVAEANPDFDITTLYQPVYDEIKPYLERIDGIAQVNVYGGRDREVRVLLDPVRMAQRGVTHADVASALRSENLNVSAGSITEGKRDYRVRVIGQYQGADDVLSTVIRYNDRLVPTRVADVADVELGYQKQRGFVRSLGHPSLAINVIRQSGANVMTIMEDLRQRLDEVRADILPNLHPELGPELRLRQVYDETVYIDSSIKLVQSNLWIGGAIAALILIMFLRSFVATGVVALAIPISVIGTFLVLLMLGRTLNVISLAGLAFAVGMVVDNAIVVLENIHRHLKSGKLPARAAYDGGREVWGAILASTLTTVAVFVPILTVQEEAGQLFRDIAIAIVGAVLLSLFVSITVIPAACALWLRPHHVEKYGPFHRALENLFGLAPLCVQITRFVSAAILWLITGWRSWTLRPLIIVVMTTASLIGAAWLMPPMDYLPAGNRNLVFGGMQTPPGLSVDQFVSLAHSIEGVVGPYVTDDEAELSRLPNIPKGWGQQGEWDPVGVDNFFIGAFDGGMFVGGTSADERRVKPVGDLVNLSIQTLPDVYGGASQASLFGRGVGGNNAINIEISGPRLERVVAAASALQGALFGSGTYSPTQVQASPGNFANPQQEYQIRIKPAGSELGLRPDSVGTVIRSLIDGAFVGDFRGQNRTIDIRLLPENGQLATLDQVRDLPISTPDGRIVPLDTLVEITPGLSQQEVQRIEELPSVTINVTPPDGVPLETAMDELNNTYIAPLSERGLIDRTMRIRLEGTAAKLDEVRSALIGRAELPGTPKGPVQRTLDILAWSLLGGAAILGVIVAVRGFRRREPLIAWGVVGVVGVGLLGAAVLMGIADQPQLTTARFIWALAVTYLLMCALFENFLYPLVIMFTVPLAIVGGFAGLRIVHDYTNGNDLLSTQNLDVLTMLGFVILVGVVVNNAILIVHQSLNNMRGEGDSLEGTTLISDPMRAIAEAVRTRIRPVFMSTLTSVGGMAPLVLFPGSGSELYRGLGSVVVGGLICATVFTLFLVPLLFSMVIQMDLGFRAAFRSRKGSKDGESGEPRGNQSAEASKKEETRTEPAPEPAMARAKMQQSPSTT